MGAVTASRGASARQWRRHGGASSGSPRRCSRDHVAAGGASAHASSSDIGQDGISHGDQRVMALLRHTCEILNEPLLEDEANLRQAGAVADILVQLTVGERLAVGLLVAHGQGLLACDDPAALLQPKFELFKRLASSERGWADVLALALCSSGPALLLPPDEFQAALHFMVAQLQRVSRRRYSQLRQPYSLYRLCLLHPVKAGDALGRHPRHFQQHVEPWLRQQLLWDDAAVADAVLSEQYCELAELDAAHAQSALDWLQQLGLSRQHAGRLLGAALHVLVMPPQQLAAQQQRVDELALTWQVQRQLAAAVTLVQGSQLSASRAALTGQLLEVMRDTAGLSEEQLLLFALGGGLDAGCTRNEASLRQATERLKDLLLVYGDWPSVATALTQHPDALDMSWAGLESLLAEPQQRLAWRMVAGMLAA